MKKAWLHKKSKNDPEGDLDKFTAWGRAAFLNFEEEAFWTHVLKPQSPGEQWLYILQHNENKRRLCLTSQ